MRSSFLIFILSSICLNSWAQIQIEQYPEERDYDASDRGFFQYAAQSVYGSGTYSLTFDDGPHPTRTPKLLDVLKKHNAKATFFVISERINAQTKHIIERMIREGHVVANHGKIHHNSNQISETVFMQNIIDNFDVILPFYVGERAKTEALFYRFPYAAYGTNPNYHHMNALRDLSYRLFNDNCIQFAFWDVDSNDWVSDMSPQDIFKSLKAHQEGGTAYTFESYRMNGALRYRKKAYTVSSPPKGGVILQHDIHERTILATDLFLTYAKDNGLKIVLLPEIEEYRISESCRSIDMNVFHSKIDL
jgi:peptidoglycan-N-acetylglucosamine deacetylase